MSINYDYLVYAVGCENQTFGIKGVNDYACFLKELSDADKIRTRLLDCVETAAFKDQSDAEIDRLMHMVVVGGGPTGVEYAGELHDFLIVSQLALNQSGFVSYRPLIPPTGRPAEMVSRNLRPTPHHPHRSSPQRTSRLLQATHPIHRIHLQRKQD